MWACSGLRSASEGRGDEPLDVREQVLAGLSQILKNQWPIIITDFVLFREYVLRTQALVHVS